MTVIRTAPARLRLGVLLLALALILLTAPARALAPGDFTTGQWQDYKALFLTDEGRIIDTGNNGISHSEGQGTGMLFAAFARDRESFDRMWGWTQRMLQRRDGLIAWKFDPARNTKTPADRNNATDGDLLIAWALLTAARAWDAPAYEAAAVHIADAVMARTLENFAGRIILLPGETGFRNLDSRTLNLSYCVFPALKEIAAATQSKIWARVYEDCLALTQQARFGTQALPLDWIDLHRDGSITPSTHRPVRFGYEAIRIPLYLIAAGHTSARDIDQFAQAWRTLPAEQAPPGWVDPISGRQAHYAASNGFLAVRKLVDGAAGPRQPARFPSLPAITRGDDYYSASLVLFSKLAARGYSG